MAVPEARSDLRPGFLFFFFRDCWLPKAFWEAGVASFRSEIFQFKGMHAVIFFHFFFASGCCNNEAVFYLSPVEIKYFSSSFLSFFFSLHTLFSCATFFSIRNNEPQKRGKKKKNKNKRLSRGSHMRKTLLPSTLVKGSSPNKRISSTNLSWISRSLERASAAPRGGG